MWKILPRNASWFKVLGARQRSTVVYSPDAFSDQLKDRQEKIFQNLQETEQLLRPVPLNRFLTTNFMRSEYDILNFALKKSDVLQEILSKAGYSNLNIIDKIFQHTNKSIDSKTTDSKTTDSKTTDSKTTDSKTTDSKTADECSTDDLRLYSKYSEFTLGGIVLALLAKCLQSVPYYRGNETKFAQQISFAESFEMLDKAIYIHQYAVMNFPLNQLNELADQSTESLFELARRSQGEQEGGKTKVSNINLNFESMNREQKAVCNEINNCNKLSILSGDYLFSFSIINIANRVNKANAFDFVGAAIDDYIMNQFRTESEIRDSIDFYDQYNLPTGNVKLEDYEINSGHGANGLLAFSAQYIAKLSDLTSIQFEKFCYDLGWNLRIKWNIEQDLKWLYNDRDRSLRLYSLPLVLYIQRHPAFVDQLRAGFNSKTIDVDELKRTLRRDELVRECTRLQSKYSRQAIDSVKILPKNRATENLRSLIL